MIDSYQLELKIAELLDAFYARRLSKIQELKLREALLRKNPYLFRATGVQQAADIVKELLVAYMSSSDEGIFGDAFFEPLAKFASGGVVSPTEGVDVVVETEGVYKAYAVKSGTNVFNAQSKRRQESEFLALNSRIRKLGKHFDAVIGYGYGAKCQKDNAKIYRELAGQEFWEEITGEPEFYLMMIRLMKDKPQEHLVSYQKAWDCAVNRFTREFTNDFCFEDGSIDWDKLVRFNSGLQLKHLNITPGDKTLNSLNPGDTRQLEVLACYANGEERDVTTDTFTTYESSDPGLVTVTGDGLLKVNEKARPGTGATITVNHIKSKKIKIKTSNIKRLIITTDAKIINSFNPGDTRQLEVLACYANGEERDVTTDTFTTYESSDPGLVTVTGDGLLKVNEKARPGTEATVTVSYIKSKKLKIKIPKGIAPA